MTAQGRLQETELDRRHLRRAVELSRIPAAAAGDLPFGAVAARGTRVLAEAHNEVASRCDPTAHAEILALRAAGGRLGRPALDDVVLYTSSEPCPMCLTACYWAGIARVLYAAAVEDTAEYGFEDAVYYRELALPAARRSLRVRQDGSMHEDALGVLRRWRDA